MSLPSERTTFNILGMYLFIVFPLYRSSVTQRAQLQAIRLENLLYFFTQCAMNIFSYCIMLFFFNIWLH